MSLLILFFYASVLLAGGLGGWVLHRRSGPPSSAIRWILVAFPLLLAAVCLLKPHGPALWLRWIPKPHLWDRLLFFSGLILIGGRGLCKIVDVAVGWARLRHETLSGATLSGAPWLDYAGMGRMLGVALPELRFHHSLRSPVVVGWRHPVILFPGRLVPRACRTADPFWEGVEAAKEDRALIRALLFHELEHVRRGDHLKLALLVINGCLLPWEWIVGSSRQGESLVSRCWVFRRLAPLARALGRPYRWAIDSERRLQESLADAAVLAYMKEGRALLARARGSPPGAAPARRPTVRDHGRELVFILAACSILGIAPGVSAVRYAWEGKVTDLLDLPKTWSLTLEPGFGKASTGLLPGRKGKPGRILVHIEELVPGHFPQLVGAGHFNLADLPESGWVEMTWDIQSEGLGAGPRHGQGQVALLFAAFRMVLDTRQDAVTVEADPSAPPEPLGEGKYRFRRRIELGNGPYGSCWLYLKYVFQDEGKWAFDPPVITIVGPDGQRRPFPAT